MVHHLKTIISRKKGNGNCSSLKSPGTWKCGAIGTFANSRKFKIAQQIWAKGHWMNKGWKEPWDRPCWGLCNQRTFSISRSLVLDQDRFANQSGCFASLIKPAARCLVSSSPIAHCLSSPKRRRRLLHRLCLRLNVEAVLDDLVRDARHVRRLPWENVGVLARVGIACGPPPFPRPSQPRRWWPCWGC